MRVSHRPTLNSNYKEFCRVNFELLRVLYRPNLNSFTSFRIIESSADKTSNYCVFKISLPLRLVTLGNYAELNIYRRSHKDERIRRRPTFCLMDILTYRESGVY
ncbi:hypothetical protein J6590_100056 [Homalodisca vitripennis]|nr:hypothetical protein J6590_100056 [Homalodisca vitripennis]